MTHRRQATAPGAIHPSIRRSAAAGYFLTRVCCKAGRGAPILGRRAGQATAWTRTRFDRSFTTFAGKNGGACVVAPSADASASIKSATVQARARHPPTVGRRTPVPMMEMEKSLGANGPPSVHSDN